MSELTIEQRKKLPKTEFAGPGKSYPVPDRTHAANAKARAKQSLNRGILSRSAYDKIVAKANKKLEG